MATSGPANGIEHVMHLSQPELERFIAKHAERCDRILDTLEDLVILDEQHIVKLRKAEHDFLEELDVAKTIMETILTMVARHVLDVVFCIKHGHAVRLARIVAVMESGKESENIRKDPRFRRTDEVCDSILKLFVKQGMCPDMLKEQTEAKSQKLQARKSKSVAGRGHQSVVAMKLVAAASLSPFKFSELLEDIEKAVKIIWEGGAGGRGGSVLMTHLPSLDSVDSDDAAIGSELELRLLQLLEKFDEHVTGTLMNFEMKLIDPGKFCALFGGHTRRITWARELLDCAADSECAVIMESSALPSALESCDSVDEALLACGDEEHHYIKHLNFPPRAQKKAKSAPLKAWHRDEKADARIFNKGERVRVVGQETPSRLKGKFAIVVDPQWTSTLNQIKVEMEDTGDTQFEKGVKTFHISDLEHAPKDNVQKPGSVVGVGDSGAWAELAEILSIFKEFDESGRGIMPREDITALLSDILPSALHKRHIGSMLDAFSSDPELDYERFLSWLAASPALDSITAAVGKPA